MFICQNCGSEHRKWAGQCPDCNQWNCITEQNDAPMTARIGSKGKVLKVAAITDISTEDTPRKSTDIDELNRVLGGGMVTGSAILIGGDPGIGKSTLLLQASSNLADASPHVLYITGEESVAQVKMRGERIDALSPNLLLIAASELESIMETINKQKPSVVVIDSIQTMVSNRLTSAPGTVSQVRDCAAALIQQAKQFGHPLILVGHVTKDGSIAGPRVLEHMVDTVLYFEGDKGHNHRILRSVKNRFGPAGEIGVFEMSDRGLIGIRDASRLFLNQRAKDAPGSVVLACLEGTRPLLVEVQALVAPTVYATPKRSSVGLDVNRVGMLTAVLERRIGIPLSRHDVYVNVTGGARILEPAADLAILIAILSAYQEQAIPGKLALFGEVGLTGEVRPVGNPESRMREAASLGFTHVLMPKQNCDRVQESGLTDTLRHQTRMTCLGARDLAQAAQLAIVSR